MYAAPKTRLEDQALIEAFQVTDDLLPSEQSTDNLTEDTKDNQNRNENEMK